MSGTLPGVRWSADDSEDEKFWIWKLKFFYLLFTKYTDLFSPAASSFFLQPLCGPANIYPIAEVEYDKLFTKKNSRAEQLKQVKIYVTLRPGTFDQKLTKLYERANTLA